MIAAALLCTSGLAISLPMFCSSTVIDRGSLASVETDCEVLIGGSYMTIVEAS